MQEKVIGVRTMSKIMVVPGDKGKFKVMVNFIQYGCEYSNQAQAEKEANEVRRLYGQPKKTS